MKKLLIGGSVFKAVKGSPSIGERVIVIDKDRVTWLCEYGYLYKLFGKKTGPVFYNILSKFPNVIDDIIVWISVNDINQVLDEQVNWEETNIKLSDKALYKKP